MNKRRTDWTFYLLLFAITPVTFIVHELAHWLTGELLGYSMTMSLNAASPVNGSFRSTADQVLVSVAGPIVTILQAIIAFLLVRQTRRPVFYPFLFIALFMRAVALLVSAWNPNDEARISIALGMGIWSLPVLVVAGLFVLAWIASRTLRLHWTVNVFCYIVASIGVTSVVYFNTLFTNTAFVPGW